MKTLIVGALLIVTTFGEAPLNNRYLPPQQGYNNDFPPQNSRQSNVPAPRQTDAIFRNRPSSSYGTPSSSPSSFGAPSNQYGPPNRGSPSQSYLPPSRGGDSRSGNRPAAFQSRAPSVEYTPPPPSREYGAPGVNQGELNQPSDAYGPPQRQYLPPGRRDGNSGDDESNQEPANYSFEYMVKDDVSGNDFGHKESRQGNRAEGVYYVLLPDGRKQTVQYEADENGYKPRISYEDTGMIPGAGSGYDRNSQNAGYDSNSQNAGYNRNNQNSNYPQGPY